MADAIIHPSLKFIQAGYALAILAAIAGIVLLFRQEVPVWAAVLPAVIILWPLSRHIRRQFTRITITGDKLRYELGMLSKTTRTIQLSKVQDVTVRQTLGQRILGVGDLSIETAGETSRLTVANIDQPQEAADKIMEIAQRGGLKTP
jgi:uncharacterized membrane protein YdbT with pleckstrin-like domain